MTKDEEEDVYSWEVGERAKVYVSGEVGKIISRRMGKAGPPVNDEEPLYELELDSGVVVQKFQYQLEIDYDSE